MWLKQNPPEIGRADVQKPKYTYKRLGLLGSALFSRHPPENKKPASFLSRMPRQFLKRGSTP
jgi:hypothetical protein